MVALMGTYLLLDKYLLPLMGVRVPKLSGFRPRTDP
jgi:hypothetical protein